MITEEGTAVILVEQHAEIALSLTEHALLLERGAIVHRARSADLLKDHATLDRYIGLRVTEGSSADSSSRSERSARPGPSASERSRICSAPLRAALRPGHDGDHAVSLTTALS